MEGSRRGKGSGEKGLPTPDPHVNGGNGKKTIVYNTKKEKKGGDTEKRLEKRKREKKGQKVEEIQQKKGKNLVLLFIVLGHVR